MGRVRENVLDSQEQRSCRGTILSILMSSYSLTVQDENLVSESIAKQFFHLQNNFVIYRTATFQVKKYFLFPQVCMLCKAVLLAVAEISWLHLQPQTDISEAKKKVTASSLLSNDSSTI